MNIYEEARRRILEASTHEIHVKAVSERLKELNKQRVAKYARSEKGRESNKRRGKRYRTRHYERLVEYHKEWKANFEKAHGMKYGTYRYRVKHGLPVVTK